MDVVGRRAPATSRLALAGARVEYAADRDAWLIHRPERIWPTTPGEGPVHVPAMPEQRDPDGGGRLATLVPMLGSLGIVAFAFVARSLAYLIVAGVMVVAILAATVGSRVISQRRLRRQHQQARADWLDRLTQARAEGAYAATVQRDGLSGLYPDLAGVFDGVREQGSLWERRPGHPDFASVRLGLGDVPAARPVQVAEGSDAPGSHVDPDLAALAQQTEAESRLLAAAPMVVSLRQLSSVALVGPRERTRSLAGCWVASLAASCAPTDLRLIGCGTGSDTDQWEWAKWLPHLRDPLAGDGFGRALRSWWPAPEAFGAALRGVVEPRLDQQRRAAESDGWRRNPDGPAVAGEHVVVLIDGYDPFVHANDPNLSVLLERGRELAVTVILLVDEAMAVPSRCGARVEVDADGECSYREAGADGKYVDGIVADSLDVATATKLARLLAPLQLADADAAADLVDTVRLVELLGHESADQVDPGTDWLSPGLLHRDAPPAEVTADVAGPSPEDLLAIPIGVRSDGAALRLDLKEAAVDGMGPHGMLIGATGSGKSELLRSLVIGLAATHSPELLNVVLVDFKGGAAFADFDRLPHTAGLITNLEDDPALIDRMRASLDGEIERRQQLLRAAGNIDSIRDYHERYADDPSAETLPYLLVIVDEFGGLLAARPEFLDVFVKIGQLGRSLGVHLLLASQRLDEGRIRNLDAHLRYRICLRTYSAAESSAVIGAPDAYELPPMPGLGYLRADNDLVRFKAATTMLPHRPVRRSGPAPAVVRPFSVARPVSGGVPAADEHSPLARGDATSPELAELIERCNVPDRRARQVWLPPLPDSLDRQQLPAGAAEQLTAAVGLLDDPARQSQQPLVLDLTGAGGHVGCVGGPRTGKTTFLRTLIAGLIENRSPSEVAVYALDLGGGLNDLAQLPHVGAVIGRHDPEAIARLLREMRATVDERAAAFRELGVTSMPALREHPRASELLPDPLAGEVILVIDNLGVLRNEFPEMDLDLTDLAATSLQLGLHIAVTANRWLDVRPALLDALGTRLELHINDPVDSIAGRAAADAVPADRPGRGLLRDGRQLQIAVTPTPVEVKPPADGRSDLHAPKVVPLPRRLTVQEVPRLASAAGRNVADEAGFLLGAAEFRLAPVRLDPLAAGEHLLVYGDQGSGRSTLLRRLVQHLAGSGVAMHIVDLGRGLLDVSDVPGIQHYAFTASLADALAKDLVADLYERLPPPDLTRDQLLARSWWQGDEHVLVVDDFDLTIASNSSPLAALSEALGYAADIGLHVILARQVAGSARTSYESFGQRLREVTPNALLLSGDRSEGPLVGERAASRQPPGRGLLLRRGRADTMVQLAVEGSDAA